MYNWQYKDWPKFHYSIDTLPTIAINFVRELGEMNGLLTAMNEDVKSDRDLQEMHEMGIFQQVSAGRSVRYELVLAVS